MRAGEARDGSVILAGNVVDAQTSSPMHPFRLSARRSSSESWTGPFSSDVFDAHDGSFRLLLPARGSWSILIECEGRVAWTSTIDVGDDTPPLLASMQRAHRVELHLADTRGRALENAEVGWVDITATRAGVRTGERSCALRTDANGEIDVENAPGGRFVLQVRPRNFAG